MRAKKRRHPKRTEARSPVSIVRARHDLKEGRSRGRGMSSAEIKRTQDTAEQPAPTSQAATAAPAAPQCPEGSQESLLRLNTPQELNEGTFRRGHPPLAVSPKPPKPKRA